MSARKSENINVWMLSREYGDLVGAGGVKDVVEQLARVQVEKLGYNVKVVLPLYGAIDRKKIKLKLFEDPIRTGKPLEYQVDMNYAFEERREWVRVWTCVINKVRLFLLESDRFTEKLAPYTYTAADENTDPSKKKGEGHYDYFCVNILHQKAALDLMMITNERPDIIHCHDGHTATLPAIINECPGYRSFFRVNGVLVTIHNAGVGYHQEVADLPFAQAVTGLPAEVIADNCLNGSFDPFLAAGNFSVINTVSQNYARELQSSDEDRRTGWLGHELLKRNVVIEGVTNGIDPQSLNPEKARALGLAAPFDPLSDDEVLEGKRLCKKQLLNILSKTDQVKEGKQYGTLEMKPDAPLFTFIGRLNKQKGVGLLIRSLWQMLKDEENFQIVLFGTGGAAEERKVIELTETDVGANRVAFIQGYSPSFANKIYAAGDFFLIPSEYEPCGLTDFIAQLFGNIPIVHHVGGLVKVLHKKTGFVYQEQDEEALAAVMTEALTLYKSDPGRIRQIQRDGVKKIHKHYTWEKVVSKYIDLYKKSVRMRLGH